MALAKPPEVLKKFGRICKLAQDNEESDPVITYYCRLYVASMGLRPEFKCKESRDFITKLLDYLSEAKKANPGDPLYTEEKVGLEYVERQALDHFTVAFKKDEAGDFGSPTLNSFLTAAALLEVLTLNGETNAELTNARKYAKYKVLYLIDCKRRNVKPVAGPLTEGDASVTPNIAGLHQDPLPPTTSKSKQDPAPAEPAEHGSGSHGGDKSGELSVDTCEKATKAAKFAISCLQYKDRDSAINYLKEALSLLSEH
ncbi:Vacuolar protein sorting-associated protein VTA1 -like protein [Echinococcus granulosus]|uniref:Vacuolar protein sorting-associated protein n=1 Tax=Echinococcus granulosus TaxID=6210 RepID=U6J907_ECHGR|nr:Vacuolar protein sorting-associated protein [Echinococcus granulosus]EUB60735.1 Vacuolar protein sorting-associated protein [Echinococcus granulosus]KAH9281667.1 Vacuolar protein sorting-associated protein VTA1 -like protein [Echinococcus granulosus]CDS18906.1 protein of unknown function DUF605 [Echinococcus granulosus]